jgi:hypothetical protein
MNNSFISRCFLWLFEFSIYQKRLVAFTSCFCCADANSVLVGANGALIKACPRAE